MSSSNLLSSSHPLAPLLRSLHLSKKKPKFTLLNISNFVCLMVPRLSLQHPHFFTHFAPFHLGSVFLVLPPRKSTPAASFSHLHTTVWQLFYYDRLRSAQFVLPTNWAHKSYVIF
jgi:hypothetical protein